MAAGTAVAAITGSQYVLRADFGIDQFLFHEEAGQVGTIVAGRMAPLTVICFTVLGFAALVGQRAPRFAIALSGVALAVSLLNVLTFVFAAAVPPILGGYTQMALSTALAMGILAVGVIGLLGPSSPLVLLAGGSPAAALLRGVLAMTIAVPAIMIWVSLQGQHLGFYDTNYGTALRMLGMISVAVVAVFASARWVRAQESKHEALEIERDRFFELSLDLLSVIDSDGIFRRVNRAWETVLGYPVGDLIGRSHLELLHPDDVERTSVEAAREYAGGEVSLGFQNRYRHHDGTYRWLEWTSRTSPDMSLAYGVARDVTARRRTEERRARHERVLESRNETLTKRAVLDPLTGLHNRRHFDVAVARMERRWGRSTVRPLPPVAVIIFDLDYFGQVNRDHGHQAGDAVLRAFAGLLMKRFREDDIVARYGGEEFVAVLEGSTATSASRVAEDIRVAFEAIAVDIGTGTPLRVTVSAGCAQLGDDRNVSAGLSVADVWLAQAKRSGRNRVLGF